MRERISRALRLAFLVLLACGWASPVSVAAPKKRPAGTESPGKPAAAALRIEVTVESLLDRRTSSDFPGPSLSISLALRGEDAAAVKSARPRITRALDDTGRDLAVGEGRMVFGHDGWQEARGEGLVSPRLELSSPARKAKSLSSVDGVLETYLPSHDPGATVKIDRVLSRLDKPLAFPALASLRVRLRVLSKAALEREKKAAEAKQAQDKKKKAARGNGDGLEAAAEAMADALVGTIQSLFSNVGENDLILKVDDPDQKIFSFDLASSDGKPIDSYGTTDVGGYRIVRTLGPIPKTASLQVRLKTAKSFGEVPFALKDVKLP